jgi:dienelactone hydrolase
VALEGFTESQFTHDGTTHAVFRRGQGPAVIVIHEVPGITPPVAAFARRVADQGFTVFAPSLFGQPGRELTAGYNLSSVVHCCIQREFALLAANRSSAVTVWLRALCRSVHAELGGKIGVIGMCMTGNFALALMVEPCVMAPVLSQPSLPVALGAERRRGLHVSNDDLVTIKRRATEEGVCVLGMRFTGDKLVPAERFARLREELGDRFEAIEIDSSRGNAHGIKATAHSVVTNDLVDREGHPTRQALERVLAFFEERLR